MEIKIGPIVYKVIKQSEEYMDFDAELESGRHLIGYHDIGASELHLLETMPPVQMAVTLWHEMLHAVSHQHNLGMEEEAVKALSYGLYELIEDNPKIFSANYNTAEEE